jgi:3-hydroxyacyl-[acyl-carrier-protein] dehydratase
MIQNNTSMEITDILKHLPHRPPFLFIDRVLEVVPGQSLLAVKNVTMNEAFFGGHFPEHPIMPGVLILEALAQAAAVLAFKTFNENPENNDLYLFAGIDQARFRQIVQPGDQLYLKVEILKLKKNLIKVLGTALVKDNVVCTAELLSIRAGVGTAVEGEAAAKESEVTCD